MKMHIRSTASLLLFGVFSLITLFSCKEDDEPTAGPVSADFDYTVSDTNPLEVSFTALDESGNVVGYAWDFGDGEGFSAEEAPTYTYSESGEYTVRLKVVNRVGDEAEASETVVISLDPAALLPGFTFEVDNLEVSFTNTSEGAVSYTWNFGDNSGTSEEVDPFYSYSEAGTYTVELTATNADGVEKTTSQDVTVTDPPAATASFSYVVDGLQVTFTNASENAVSYSWDFGDGTGTSTDENPVYTYTEAGDYTVTLTATAANDESDEESVDIYVGVNPLFTPGNNNYFDTFSGEEGSHNVGEWAQTSFSGVKPTLTRGVENPDPNDTAHPLVGKYERVGTPTGTDSKYIRILADPSAIPLTWDERTRFSIRVYMPSSNDPDNTDLERKVAFKLRSGGSDTEINVSTTLPPSADDTWTTVELDLADATGAGGRTFDPDANYSSFIIQLGGENETGGRGEWYLSDLVRLAD